MSEVTYHWYPEDLVGTGEPVVYLSDYEELRERLRAAEVDAERYREMRTIAQLEDPDISDEEFDRKFNECMTEEALKMTTTTEKRRVAFEAWFAEKYTNHRLSPQMTNCGILTGGYSDSRVDLAWQAYNAALDNVCVELPEPFSIGDGEGAALCPVEVKEALAAAGIRYK